MKGLEMKLLGRGLLGLALAAGVALPLIAAQKEAPKGVEGIWQGTLNTGAIELRLVVKIKKQTDGKLAGTLDSLDQNARDIPIDTVTFKDNALRLELKGIGGLYEGKANKEGTEIVGKWTQGGGSLPLTLKRVEKAPEIRRPQEPQKPYPYLEEEVTFSSKQAGVKLAGTLTRPKGDGPFPAAILITGSGPQDRDEALLGHRPFLVLADYLTRKGIAVLRFDDRGVGKSTGNFETATSADFADDVRGGLAYLRGRKEIDPARIGLIGHSEGGLIAPMVAADNREVAFIVLMAGTGVPGEEILFEQSALIAKAGGATDQVIAVNREIMKRSFALIRSEAEPAAIEKKMEAIIKEETAKLPEAQQKEIRAAEGALKAQIQMASSPWFRYFLLFDPKTALRKVTCPVLAINGEKDLQVPPKQNLPVIEKTLKEAGNTDVTVKELPGLNHLFQTCQTGAPSEYGRIEETIAPAALEMIADWILARMRK